MATNIPDLRDHTTRGGNSIFSSSAGRFFKASEHFKSRLKTKAPSGEDNDWLVREGFLAERNLAQHALAFRRAQRVARNISCSYCQVSRADVEAKGFDWSQKTLDAVAQCVGEMTVPNPKIEFQGGEPSLRPDLIKAVIEATPSTVDPSFVICTNLQSLSDEFLEIVERPDVQISTSLDGDFATHARQRQGGDGATQSFMCNLDALLERFGPDKISALPTIDMAEPPAIDDLIDAYAKRGLTSIYLRPVNYHGFARKRHPASLEQSDKWREYHQHFVRRIIERNWNSKGTILEETYFSHVLRRIYQPGVDGHVDLRNPNAIGRDYVVVDYDGRVYPTDEARMLTRSGVIDLAIGDIYHGWDTAERDALDAVSTNLGDPVCDACAYQPFCGRDVIDDIARYGTISLPRDQTEFCKRHLDLFDFAFDLIHERDERTRYSLRRWLGLAGNSLELGIER
jgi:His-Xaa-Ser system radical SAM maturase HxsB